MAFEAILMLSSALSRQKRAPWKMLLSARVANALALMILSVE
jgi:hypothetical protein